MTVRDALRQAPAVLAESGIDTAATDAEWLLADALGVGRVELSLLLGRELSVEEAARFRAALGRRATREPLQHVLGWEAFHGLRLRVTPDVLVPRPETEVLAAWVGELVPPRPGSRRRVVDVGTGSGCIACAIARARGDIDVIALDLSVAAARIASANARALGLCGRVTVVVGDLLAPLRPITADAVVSNPPYLSSGALASLPLEVSQYDPRLALDGGVDGLAVIRRLVASATAWLGPGGILVLETAGEAQRVAVDGLMQAHGFGDLTERRDLAGIARFVAGRFQPPAASVSVEAG